MEVDAVYTATFSPAASINIKRVLPKDAVVLGAPHSQFIRRAGICFSLNLRGAVAKDLAEAARKRCSETSEGLSPREWRAIGHSTRSIVVNRVLFDDLTRLATVSVLAAAICSDDALSAEFIVADFGGDRRDLYRRFRVNSLKSTASVKSQAPSLRQAVDFVMRRAGMQNPGMTPFMRGLSYFQRSLEYGWRDEAARLIWSVAAIEALLKKPSETGSGLLTTRLVAALGSQDKDIANKFRELHKFRSKYVHRSLDIPIIVAEDHAMPNVKSPSFLLGEREMVGLSHDIARCLIRRMILLNRDELKFATRLVEQDHQNEV